MVLAGVDHNSLGLLLTPAGLSLKDLVAPLLVQNAQPHFVNRGPLPQSSTGD